MIDTIETISLLPADKPNSSNLGITNTPSCSAPRAADKNPHKVIPTCAAARKRFGLPASFATCAPRLPLLDICLTWESRREIRAISAATKIPPTAISPKTIAILGKAPSAISPMVSNCADSPADERKNSGASPFWPICRSLCQLSQP